MREIKFRAWHNTRMIYDVGYIFLKMCTGMHISDETFIPLQFTGLKDKNGVEIYEGDIVREDDGKIERGRVEVVNFREGIFEPFDGYRGVGAWNCEVIGNIYEDKHLLND